MRRLLTAAALILGVSFALTATSPAFADADASVQQIYNAAAAGRLDQAQQMMTQVLKDHPQSARAHYVQAELYAKEGKTALSRSELGAAEQLKPGLPFASPRSVQALKAQLGLGARSSVPRTFGTARSAGGASVPAAPGFPWGILLTFGAAIAILWAVFRRRNNTAQYASGSGPGGGGAPGVGAPGNYGPGGYGAAGYGPAPMRGGLGSSIAGGLASGLAVGAGVVAGEQLAHHFLDGGQPTGGGIIPPAEAGEPDSGNGDMGGSDFGMNDPGGGWDDGGSGGGGDDWS